MRMLSRNGLCADLALVPFQMPRRKHNQILVPTKPRPTIKMTSLIHLDRKAVHLVPVEGSATFQLQFEVHSSVAGVARVYTEVEDRVVRQESVQPLKGPIDPTASGSFAAGSHTWTQQREHAIDISKLDAGALKWNPTSTKYPIVICVRGEAASPSAGAKEDKDKEEDEEEAAKGSERAEANLPEENVGETAIDVAEPNGAPASSPAPPSVSSSPDPLPAPKVSDLSERPIVTTELTYCCLETSSSGIVTIKVIKQLVFFHDQWLILHDIYGQTAGPAPPEEENNERKEKKEKKQKQDKQEDDCDADTESIEDEDSEAICVVCMSAPRSVAIFPCRHMCVCPACAEMVRVQTARCPICRCVVESLLDMTPK